MKENHLYAPRLSRDSRRVGKRVMILSPIYRGRLLMKRKVALSKKAIAILTTLIMLISLTAGVSARHAKRYITV